MPDPTLATTFNFVVTLRATGGGADYAGDGGFQEVSGLEVELDVQEYLEGGSNDRVVRRVGRAKYSPLVLKRGMFLRDGRAEGALWEWVQQIAAGRRPVPRCDGTVTVLGGDRVARVATWSFDRALPMKVVGPRLDARTGEVAIEELHLAHEGLRLSPQGGAGR